MKKLMILSLLFVLSSSNVFAQKFQAEIMLTKAKTILPTDGKNLYQKGFEVTAEMVSHQSSELKTQAKAALTCIEPWDVSDSGLGCRVKGYVCQVTANTLSPEINLTLTDLVTDQIASGPSIRLPLKYEAQYEVQSPQDCVVKLPENAVFSVEGFQSKEITRFSQQEKSISVYATDFSGQFMVQAKNNIVSRVASNEVRMFYRAMPTEQSFSNPTVYATGNVDFKLVK